MRGVRYTVLKYPGKLTDRRSEASGNLRDTDPKGRLFCFNVCSTGSAVFFRSVG